MNIRYLSKLKPRKVMATKNRLVEIVNKLGTYRTYNLYYIATEYRFVSSKQKPRFDIELNCTVVIFDKH